MSLSIRQETVTPAIAEKWLEGAQNPRKLSGTRVSMYANAMINDEWRETGEAIQFDTAGKMKNGQHRLHAIITSGKSQKMVVVRDVEPEAVKVMDSGLARSVGDYIASSLGVGYSPSRMAAAARAILGWHAGLLHNPNMMSRTITRTAIADFAVNNAERLMASIRKAEITYNAIGGNFSAWAAAYYEMADESFNQEEVDTFFESMVSGQGLELGNAMLATRNWFVQWSITNRKNATLQIAHGLYIIVKGWNRWINEEYTERIRSEGKTVIVPAMLATPGKVKEILKPKAAAAKKAARKTRAKSAITVVEVPDSSILKTPNRRVAGVATAG